MSGPALTFLVIAWGSILCAVAITLTALLKQGK